MSSPIDVVIPSYQSWATLQLTLSSLEPQVRDRSDRRVIVVDSSGDRSQAAVDAEWPWVRFILLPDRTLPGTARNVGIADSDAELIAFTDADAVPAPDWLDQLVAAMGDAPAVAGAIENGTPASTTGTAQYFLEFAEWIPERQKPLFHAATCNLLVRRDAFVAAGGFDEHVWPGEDTMLTLDWGRHGQLRFAPRAVVHHINRTGTSEFLRHQSRLGVAFFHVCRTTGFPYRFLGHRPVAPLAAAARLLALYRQLRPAPRRLRHALRLLPVVLLGLVAWSVGFATAGGTNASGRQRDRASASSRRSQPSRGSRPSRRA